MTFPLVRSALLAGGLLAFALSFDEIVVTSFTAGPGVETLPQWILNNLSRPNNVAAGERRRHRGDGPLHPLGVAGAAAVGRHRNLSRRVDAAPSISEAPDWRGVLAMGDVVLDDVSRVHPDGTVALDHVGLTAYGGEILALVGASGAGKSTLLRVIAGLDPISGGTIHIDGQLVNGLSPAQRGVALNVEGGVCSRTSPQSATCASRWRCGT